MRRKPFQVTPPSCSSYDPAFHNAILIWFTRLFEVYPLTQELLESRGVQNGTILRLFQIPRSKEPLALRRLQVQVRKVQRAFKAGEINTHTPLWAPIAVLQKALGLSNAEVELLHFFLCMHYIDDLDSFFDDFPVGESRLMETLSVLVSLPKAEIEAALNAKSTLMMTRLVEECDCYTLEDRFSVSENFIKLCTRGSFSVAAVQEMFVQKSPSTDLSVANYPHVAEEFHLACGILKNAIEERRVGCNVLVYGPPGVGKTELARAIAQHLNIPLWMVATKTSEGRNQNDSLNAAGRVGNLWATQKILNAQRNALVLFDEVEEVFPAVNPFAFLMQKSGSSGLSKSFINEVLETNPFPVIWVGNRVDHIDDAHLRRFSLCIEIDHIPLSVKRTIVEQNTQGVSLKEETRNWLAHHDKISPALLARAAESAKAIVVANEPADDVVKTVIENHLGAMGCSGASRISVAVTSFDTRYTNCSIGDVDTFLTKMVSNPQGRILMYGAPGTGKTELAREMARRLQRPALVTRASDLLGCYVGETEKSIAKLFARCTRTKEFLIIDEADSFLTSRQQATRSWEVTAVNEMLTQIEAFEGWLAFTTNLMNNLDEASIRRFDMKVEFFPLKSEQVADMIVSEMLGGILPDGICLNDVKRRTASFGVCTPGDFAAVKRRQRIHGIESDGTAKYLDWVLQEIGEEQKAKSQGNARGIGFCVG